MVLLTNHKWLQNPLGSGKEPAWLAEALVTPAAKAPSDEDCIQFVELLV